MPNKKNKLLHKVCLLWVIFLVKPAIGYQVEEVSLNFQDIEIRAALQVLAEASGFNIIASDSVKGNITLHLKDIPWEQALELILKAKGLSKRQEGNVIWIGPSEEIFARETLELERLKKNQSLAPVQSVMIQLRYATAKIFAQMLQEEKTTFLSERGRVIVDERTNTLLVQDVNARVRDIKKLIQKLDIPVRQVLIEAQIVEVTDNTSRDIGLRLGGGGKYSLDKNTRLALAGAGVNESDGSFAETGSDAAGRRALESATSNTLSRGLFFDGGVSPATGGRLGLSLFKLAGSTLLDLELRALEAENKATITSRPKLMTVDKQTAYIESGREVPFESTSANNGTTVEFKNALTRLEVTPQITPNNKISLTLLINRDDIGATVKGIHQAPITKEELKTTVLIDNGQTVVLGGLYTHSEKKNESRVPYLSNIPLVGRLFRRHDGSFERKEVLVFVTPKIIEGVEN